MTAKLDKIHEMYKLLNEKEVSVQFSHLMHLEADKQGHLEISHNHNWTKILVI